jgi:pSer/pThr/pTyr-binding forkhead associated (FHA) protein
VAKLVLESGGEKRELKLTGRVTIGRAQHASVCIDDKTLSREHTEIYPEQGRFLVRDLESKNGTFLNGSLVRQAEPLKHGDRIRVGPATFVFLMDPSDVPPVPGLSTTAKPAAAAPAPPTRPAPAAPRPITSVPARARPRAPGDAGVDVADVVGGVVAKIILIAVVVVGAYLSKGLFVMILSRIPS